MGKHTLRIILFIIVASVHGLLIIFLAFRVNTGPASSAESAHVMKLTDIIEEPPPPPPAEEERPVTEVIAETMIETDTPPDQTLAAAGTITAVRTADPFADYLPMHKLSTPPQFDEKLITGILDYPPIARRSGIGGRVILELFIDRGGTVRQVTVLREEPEGWGFAGAAVKAFEGFRCSPALANGEAVSSRFRYPVTFKIRQ
jgi:protein TonB